MEKNTVWAIVLSTVVLVVFMTLQMVFFPAPQPAAGVSAAENIASEQVSSGTVPVNSITPNNTVVNNTAEVSESISEQKVTIETNKFTAVLTNRGGDVISLELKDHKDGNKGVELADSISAVNRAFSVSLGDFNQPIINDVFNVKRLSDYSVGFYKKLSVKNADGSVSYFTLVKEYTFLPDEYVFKLDIHIDGEDNFSGLNFGTAAYTLRTSPQIGPKFNKKKDRYENRTFMTYANDKRKKQNIGENTVKEQNGSFSWTGVAGKYFVVLISPQNTQITAKSVYSTRIEANDYANAQAMVVRNAAAGKNITDSYYIYAGPRTENVLKKYTNAADNGWQLAGMRFDESMESIGILSWLEISLKWVMELLYKLIPNWGISIIIMTILLKLILFPLTKKSSVATLRMQEMQPKMKELQDKYKGQPEKLNVEMAKFYKDTGYNPMSGCLPMLIQFPLIIAMFNLFNNYFEFRGAMFIPGWIPDLSVGDSILTFGFDIPFVGNQLRILPIIYVISQLFYGKIAQTPGSANNGQMKFMMYGMPLIFFFVFYNAPSGLILYWTFSNLLQLVQQVIINKTIHGKKSSGKETAVLPFKKAKK